MQPVQSPEEYQVAWLQERGLFDAQAIAEARRRLEKAISTMPVLSARFPTLLTILAEMGRLTPEQCDEGERETKKRRAEFMAWRSQLMEKEERMRAGRPPQSPQ